MRKLLLALCCAFFLCMPNVNANPIHDMQDDIGTDKFAHAGVGYIIADQLERNAGFSPLVDDTFDKGDIGATLTGPLIYQIDF